MAIIIDKIISDSASTASFEISGTGDAGGDTTSITVADLTGAGDDDNQEVMVTRVVSTVASTDVATSALVTLSWGGDGMFLVLPPGLSDINQTYRPSLSGAGQGDISVESAPNTSFSVKIYVKKVTGFPKSMGHANHRP